MPTVVDSLVVTLGLDPANFTKGQKEAADALLKTQKQANSTAKNLQADGQKAADFFRSIKVEFLALTGVLLGGKGIEAFTRDTTRSMADLGRQARNIGESAPAIEAFAMAVQRMGGNAESARGVLQNFAQQRAEFVNFGRGNFGPEMALIGGNIDTKPLEAIQLFQAYIEKMKDTAGGIQKINLIGKDVFGFDQATMNSLIQMGSVVKLNKEIGRSYELGAPTPEQIERLTKLQEALIGLEQAGTGAGRALLSDTAPGITAVATALSNLIGNNPHAAEAVAALTVALTAFSGIKLASGIFSFVGLTEASAAIGGLTTSLTRFLALPGLAAFLAYEGFHIGGLNKGEDEDLRRLRKEHGMNPDGSGGNSLPDGTPSVGSSGNPSDPRGIRNNNPLNLAYVPGQPGVTGTDGRFGVYKTMEEGIASELHQFALNQGRGANTLRKQLAIWAPPSDNPAGYPQQISRMTGIPLDAPLDMTDPTTAHRVIREMAKVENGRPISDETIRKGVGLATGRLPRVFAGAVAPPPPLPPRLPPTPSAASGATTNHNTFGSLVLPNVTNAQQFARELPGALAAQANRGPA